MIGEPKMPSAEEIKKSMQGNQVKEGNIDVLLSVESNKENEVELRKEECRKMAENRKQEVDRLMPKNQQCFGIGVDETGEIDMVEWNANNKRPEGLVEVYTFGEWEIVDDGTK